MTDQSISSPSSDQTPKVRSIDMDQPWAWLQAGWRDLWRLPGYSLSYGILVTFVSYVLTFALFSLELSSIVLVLAAGFMFLGPLLAVGLYELSRRLETGEPVEPSEIFFVKTRSPVQIGFLAVILMLAILAWTRIATLLFALFFGLQPFPPLSEFLSTLLFSWYGLSMLIIGTLVGGAIAFAVFAISAVSIPLLMVRDTDAFTAIMTSIRAVRQNFKPMLLWAWLIAVLTFVGIIFGYLGLIVTFPLIGHATWHAYRSLIEEQSG